MGITAKFSVRQEGGAGEREKQEESKRERKMEMEEGRWQREQERCGNKHRGQYKCRVIVGHAEWHEKRNL